MPKKTRQPDSSIASQLSMIARLCNQLLESELALRGIALQDFRIMGLLMGEVGISQKELAEKLSVRPATLSIAIDRLVEKGSVRRTPSARDGRMNLLTLAPGIDFAPANKLLKNLEAVMLEGASARDSEALRKLLPRMAENLDEAQRANRNGARPLKEKSHADAGR